MRSIMLAALALPMLTAAAAESWFRVGGNANVVTYVDAGSIQRSGDKAQAWVQTVLAKPVNDRVYSARIHYEFDCKARHYRSLRYAHYGAAGELLSDHPSTTSDQLRRPDPGAISESIMGFVCERTGGVAAPNPKADAAIFFK